MSETEINRLKQATELLGAVLQRARNVYRKDEAVREKNVLKEIEDKFDHFS